MNLHTHLFYLLEQHSKSFKMLSAFIRINNEGKSLIMKLGPGPHAIPEIMFTTMFTTSTTFLYYFV